MLSKAVFVSRRLRSLVTWFWKPQSRRWCCLTCTTIGWRLFRPTQRSPVWSSFSEPCTWTLTAQKSSLNRIRPQLLNPITSGRHWLTRSGCQLRYVDAALYYSIPNTKVSMACMFSCLFAFTRACGVVQSYARALSCVSRCVRWFFYIDVFTILMYQANDRSIYNLFWYFIAYFPWKWPTVMFVLQVALKDLILADYGKKNK